MLSWMNTRKSEALEKARARARERARAPVDSAVLPTNEGMVVEEITAEEFLRQFPEAARSGKAP